MSYLEYNVKTMPTGLRKMLYLHWPLIILLTATAAIGFLMLYSVAGGVFSTWSEPQMERYVIGLAAMLTVAMFPVWFWRDMSVIAYLVALLLLFAVPIFGVEINGSQRWIDLGGFNIQPSELMKLSLIMMLAAYYEWLPPAKVSRPFWVLVPVLLISIPAVLVLEQPDLGTAILLLAAGGAMMFLAGVHWAYFAAVLTGGICLIAAVFQSRGTHWQLLKDYQYERIDIFLDPTQDPLDTGYHITQSKIALGSGGWSGKGFMQGTQSQLNFLPEKHTDFIFVTLAEEFGFIGAITLLGLYTLIIVFCIATAISNRDRFSSLFTLGMALTFFMFFAVNMSMVMGLLPVVGVPLPLVSYGGSAMLMLMTGFGIVQSAHIHKPRKV